MPVFYKKATEFLNFQELSSDAKEKAQAEALDQFSPRFAIAERKTKSLHSKVNGAHPRLRYILATSKNHKRLKASEEDFLKAANENHLKFTKTGDLIFFMKNPDEKA